MRRAVLRAVTALMVLGIPAAAAAQPAGEFFPGKQLRVLVGTEAGTFFDSYARLLVRHMGKHIPGQPSLLAQNMPGAGSLTFYNHLYNVAPKDGTVFGIGHRAVPLMPLLGIEGPKFEAHKFNFIGSMNNEDDVCIVRDDSGIRTVQDLKTKELMVGTTGRGAELTTFYATIQSMLGAKLKVITGYRSTNDLYLAVERGEIQGRCGGSYANVVADRPQLVAEGKILVVLQIAPQPNPKIANVPSLLDLVSAEDRPVLELMVSAHPMGRPFIAPPDVPADRVAVLRKSFGAMMKDPGLLADAQKQNLDMSAVTGAEMAAIIEKAYRTPEPIIAKARQLVVIP
jgi:tripartite-type tricarboxylate transporter receptor subunit TctC